MCGNRCLEIVSFLAIALLLLAGCARTEVSYDLSTALMRSTFKVAAEGLRGTVFVLERSSGEGAGTTCHVLITAAHVLENVTGDSIELVLRKKTDGTYERLPFAIPIREEGKDLWVRHPKVDISAMYVDLPDQADVGRVSTDRLANDDVFKKFEIHPGDEVMCLGYPGANEANPAGFPILRSGKIASYPLLPSEQNEYFLVHMEVLSGDSGGPAYLCQRQRFYAGQTHQGPEALIVGVVGQHRVIGGEKLCDGKTDKTPSLLLAKVIHAQFVKETVELLKPCESN
ncbi:hypothetical protein E3J62_03130 [candidate division TA06 bacterium]|uniref:Serine protease n=1 Tax=candidate division TA06 bacterium TaxID=2250710 RepID=A0A523UWB5_UNCT6|nr:MAG: hypothetical protein E3J62_03130 [candidate division TA06 bacterium]